MRRKWVQFWDLAATEDKKRRMTKGKRDEKERGDEEKKEDGESAQTLC